MYRRDVFLFIDIVCVTLPCVYLTMHTFIFLTINFPLHQPLSAMSSVVVLTGRNAPHHCFFTVSLSRFGYSFEATKQAVKTPMLGERAMCVLQVNATTLL